MEKTIDKIARAYEDMFLQSAIYDQFGRKFRLAPESTAPKIGHALTVRMPARFASTQDRAASISE